MLKVGLTGGIGSGKTAASDYFASLGVPVIDTDIIARTLVQPDSPALQRILDEFGKHLLNEKGQLDRAKLAQYIFNDATKRRRLETILHPLITQQMQQQLAALTATEQPSYVIIVIPLLLETGMQTLVDRILVIDADENTRIKRVQDRDQRSQQDIKAIIQNQINRESRLQQADDILNNNGNLQDLYTRIDHLHKQYSQ